MNIQTFGLHHDGVTQSNETMSICMDSSPIDILASWLEYLTDYFILAAAPGTESKGHAAKPILEAAAMNGWLCWVEGTADCGVCQKAHQ